MLTTESRLRDFPQTDASCYLNTAAEGLPPRTVLSALEQYGRDKLLGMDGRVLHQQQRQRLQAETANALNLRSQDIGICACASEAFQLTSLAMQFREGDEVVINDLDFPAGATPWLQPTCPASVKIWRSRNGVLDPADLAPLLSKNTRLVSTSLVSFLNGFRLHLDSIHDMLRRLSPALLAVDVTQALGRISLDDISLADLTISATHKWILGPHGGGLVGVNPRVAEQLTAHAGGWFHLENAFEPDRFESAVTKTGAASFSVGMPNYAAIYGCAAALEYIQNVGVEAIEKHCLPLVEQCLDGLKKLNVELISPDRIDELAGILAFVHPQADRIHHLLHEQGIHIMSHAGRLRIAIHGYNTSADIDQLLSVLSSALSLADS